MTQAHDPSAHAQIPRDADALAAAAVCLDQGKPADAYRLLAGRSFDDLHGAALAHALSLRGVAALVLHDPDAASDDFEACVALTPDDPRAWINLSIAYGRARRYSHALGPASRAAAIAPHDHAAVHNHAVALEHAGHVEDAVRTFEHACALSPADAKSREGLAVALEHAGRFDDAARAYSLASSLDPANPSSRMKLGMLLLLTQGSTAQPEAWALYESRIEWMNTLGVLRRFVAPRWTPDAPPHSRVVVYGEQGLGDALQFARFLPHLRRRCGQLILTAKPEVASLLAHAPGVDLIVPEADGGLDAGNLPPHDAWIPLLSIPHQLDLLRLPLPSSAPLLTHETAALDRWQRRLAPLPGLRVGIAWAGSPFHHNDHNRSIDPRRLEPLAHTPGVSWVSLQKGSGALRNLGPLWTRALHDWTEHLGDMADTAALVQCLDLVLCVDTSVCHLAGTLHRPVWTLLPWVPDWRWGAGQHAADTTPWYPSMRLFRQPRMNDWESVTQRVSAELSAAAEHHAKAGHA